MPRFTQAFAPRDRDRTSSCSRRPGSNLLKAAALLDDAAVRVSGHAGAGGRTSCDLEHEGDRITHDIIDRLNHTFVTPIDREDILALASALDDIVDYIEEVADYLGLYKIEAPMDQAIKLARGAQGRDLSRSPRRSPTCAASSDISATRWRSTGWRTRATGSRVRPIASLFDGGIDPMVVIRWKDIFERLEAAIDATEHVAHILEGIVIKNS
jgi:uncharacterized protein Yka (UPF0111/DUF47 family)